MSDLSDLRVLDLTSSLAGPLCAMMLGDMGADVIKVERPGTGDDFRESFGGYYFPVANRNKKSITLNLKSAEGRRILHSLAKKSDILIENYRPGLAAKLGVDHETLNEINPLLVVCSITGFGKGSPYENWAAYDLITQAMGGIMSMTGSEMNGPVPVGIPISDLLTALYAYSSILVAINVRNKNRKGQHIEIALLDSVISSLSLMAMYYFATGAAPKPGEKSKLLVPYGIFNAKDGIFVLEAASEGTWRRLCTALGLKVWLDDVRFATAEDRVKQRDLIIATLSELFAKRPVNELISVLASAGVPCGPINDLSKVFADPHIKAREMVVEMKTEDGLVRMLGIPSKFSMTPALIRLPPPRLGQHTDEILTSLGHKPDEIERLKREGVV